MSIESQQAARNSAEWCASVCRAHGDPGSIGEHAWIHGGDTPRYHSNGITLSDRTSPELHQVLQSRDSWSVKDSFAQLDLSKQGGRVLFEAQWLWREAQAAQETAPWTRVRTAHDLAAWERAWRRASADRDERRVFLPDLLEDEDIVVIAWQRGDVICGGGILFHGAGVVSLSNTFGAASDAQEITLALSRVADALYPTLPQVDYESGEALQRALACGFRSVGPLRVWVRP